MVGEREDRSGQGAAVRRGELRIGTGGHHRKPRAAIRLGQPYAVCSHEG
jgi:hypothetical protein